jgi:hypothetical protein
MIIFIFIATAFVICMVLVFGMVMPKEEMQITSEIVINKPQNIVWNYVRLIRNQEHYNVWILQDRNIKMEYTGTDGTPGFIAAWQSRTRMGDGEQKILTVDDGSSYEAELRFRNHDNTTTIKLALEPAESGMTKVKYTMLAMPAFPMNMMVPVMKNMIKKDMDKTLSNLKKTMEA